MFSLNCVLKILCQVMLWTPCIGVYTMYTWRIKQECQGNKMPMEFLELEL